MTSDDLDTGPTTRPTTLHTDDGCDLEAVWTGPSAASAVVVLTHPHPRYGGDMHNLVPASLARSLPEHGYATLRFNFRGTGASTGSHGGGGPERLDVAAAITAAHAAHPDTPVLAVGYSFGADVLLSVDDTPLAAVVAVAPPLSVLPIAELEQARTATPTLILAPEHDQFRPTASAVEATETWPATAVRGIAGADHLLAGAATRLTEEIVRFFDPIVAAQSIGGGDA